MSRNSTLAARLWIGALLAAGLPGSPAVASDTVVRASLEPQVIGVGETATFTIEVRGTGMSRLSFRPDFELENLDVVGGPNQYDDVQIANGTLSRTYRLSWQVRPRAVGKARVHSLRVQLDDELIQMRDREITVQEEPTQQAEAAGDEEPQDPFDRFFGPLLQRRPEPSRQAAVFLRAEVQPQRPYAGQQVLYTVYLYTRDDITSMAAREIPTFRGFWVRDVPQPQHLPTDMVTVGNDRYGRVVVLQKALFPLRPGHYTIEPAAMDVIARVVESRWFGPPFARPEQVQVQAPALQVDVQPLPPAPPDLGGRFTGTVGQMALTAKLEPAQLRLGEAATLTVKLVGRGNVQGVAEPRVLPPPGLKIFPPQQQGEDRVVGTTVQGARTWSWVVVPERSGRASLQVPEIPYFDPQSGQYRVAAVPPIEVTTLPPAVASTSTGMLHSIRDAAARPEGGLRPALSWPRLLPWLFALPWAIALLVTLARRRQQPQPGKTAAPIQPAAEAAPAPRQPPAHETMERRLRDAAAEARPRQAAAHIEEAWRAFLIQRWEIPAGTPTPRWGELLRARGADAEAAEELVHLADDLHYLRYAPQLSATETLMAEALSRSRRLLRRLR
jgi:hypothetical protein